MRFDERRPAFFCDLVNAVEHQCMQMRVLFAFDARLFDEMGVNGAVDDAQHNSRGVIAVGSDTISNSILNSTICCQ